MAGKTQTYVEFLIPGSFFAETEVKKVLSRDINHLTPPAYAFGFQFFDITTAIVDGEKLEGNRKNYSKRYLIAEEVMTAAEAIKKHADKDSLVSNIRNNKYKHICQTNRGNFQPLDNDTVVVNGKMEIIWGTEAKKIPAAKKAPARKQFKEAALKKSITVRKPLQLKPLPDDVAPELRVPKAATPDNVVKKLRTPKA